MGGRPLLALTLGAVAASGAFDRIVVATPSGGWEAVGRLAAAAGLGDALTLVEGGERRQDSVRAALPACGDAEVIAVHDAARPLCPPEVFHAVIAAARTHGAATAAIAVVDSIKEVDANGRVARTLDRSRLVAVQTPQAFHATVLRAAHAAAATSGLTADDDCALVEDCGEVVVTVPGDLRNLKITRPADLLLLRALAGDAA